MPPGGGRGAGTRERALPRKVVVRKLPYALNEEGFKSTIEKYAGQYDWISYQMGKIGTKKSVYSRAFMNFKTADLAQEFLRQFNGHAFIDSKGTEFKAEVEFAVYQRVPKSRRPDARQNTIEKDADFLAFCELLKKVPDLLPSAEVQMDRREAEEKAAAAAHGGSLPTKTTPLLEALREKRRQKAEAKANARAREDARGPKRIMKREGPPPAQAASAAAASGAGKGEVHLDPYGRPLPSPHLAPQPPKPATPAKRDSGGGPGRGGGRPSSAPQGGGRGGGGGGRDQRPQSAAPQQPAAAQGAAVSTVSRGAVLTTTREVSATNNQAQAPLVSLSQTAPAPGTPGEGGRGGRGGNWREKGGHAPAPAASSAPQAPPAGGGGVVIETAVPIAALPTAREEGAGGGGRRGGWRGGRGGRGGHGGHGGGQWAPKDNVQQPAAPIKIMSRPATATSGE
eukprot:tig00020572_g11580.t1